MRGLHKMHNFLTFGHEKGEHDRAGAIIKRTLTHEEFKPDDWPMKRTVDVVSFLNTAFQSGNLLAGIWGPF